MLKTPGTKSTSSHGPKKAGQLIPHPSFGQDSDPRNALRREDTSPQPTGLLPLGFRV